MASIIHPKQTNNHSNINRKTWRSNKNPNQTMSQLHSYLRGPFPVRLCSAVNALSPPPMPTKPTSLFLRYSLTSSQKLLPAAPSPSSITPQKKYLKILLQTLSFSLKFFILCSLVFLVFFSRKKTPPKISQPTFQKHLYLYQPPLSVMHSSSEKSATKSPPPLLTNDLQLFRISLDTCQPLVCSLIPLHDAIATKRESTCGYSQLQHLEKKM